MMQLVADEALAEKPRTAALILSLLIHIGGLAAWDWVPEPPLPPGRFVGVVFAAPEPSPLYFHGNTAAAVSSAVMRDAVKDAADEAYVAEAVPDQPPSKEPDVPLLTPTAIPSEYLRFLEEEHARPQISLPDVPAGTTNAGSVAALRFTRVEEAATPPPPPLPRTEPGEAGAAPPPVRIGGKIEPPVLVDQTLPSYPGLAVRARVEGTVVVQAVITTEGRLTNVHAVSGHPLLIEAALDCVKGWRYRPAILNGMPVESPVSIQVRFKLERQGG